MASVSVSYLIYLHNDNFICTFFPYTIFMCVAGCEQTRIYRVSLYFDSVWNNWKTRSCVHSHSYPVLGGVQIIGFGMFIGLVMSNLQYIDMQSTINLAIIGVSTLLGLMLPFWAKGNAAGINRGIILNNERHFMVIGERSFCYSFFYLSQMVV